MSIRKYDLNPRQKYTKEIKKFLGVDYSTQKFLVGDGRAIDSLNFIYKNGVVQKRNGFTEIYKIKPTKYIPVDFDGLSPLELEENKVNFNGIWSMVFEDGKRHIIAHIGNLLYEVKNIENKNIEFEPIYYSDEEVYLNGEYLHKAYKYEDYKSSAFPGGNKLWFLGGNKFMVIRFINNYGVLVEPVENNSSTPIPVTTISITYQNAIAGTRASLDNVNLLQMLRKNKLISGVGKNEDDKTKTDYYDYTLDSPLVVKNEFKDMSKFKLIIEERGVIE